MGTVVNTQSGGRTALGIVANGAAGGAVGHPGVEDSLVVLAGIAVKVVIDIIDWEF